MDSSDIILNIAGKLRGTELIQCSRLNNLWYQICHKILSKKTDEQLVRTFMHISTMTCVGKLNPNANIKKLFLSEKNIPEKLFVEKTGRKSFLNQIGLVSVKHKVHIKIFTNGTLKLTKIKHSGTLPKIVRDLDKLCELKNCDDGSLKPIFINVNFELKNSIEIDFIKLIRSIEPNANLHFQTSSRCTIKYDTGSIIFFDRSVSILIILSGKSFVDIFTQYKTIRLAHHICLCGQKIKNAYDIDDGILVRNLLRNHRSLFMKPELNELMTDICINKQINMFDLLLSDYRVQLGISKTTGFVTDQIIFRLWLIRMIYTDIFPLDIINYICVEYYCII